MVNTDSHRQLVRYGESYSERRFWRKLSRFARTAGREVVEAALCLFYAAQRPETPAWAKAVAIGALGYFVLPADAIPDIAPVIGYTDDLGVLGLAMATIAVYVDDNVRWRAQQTLRRWFGD
jgi:uncharacterized membrane protein YkvA (DUF1232 family)